MKKWKEWTTKQKTMLGVGIAAVVLIGGGGTVYGVEKTKQQERQDAQLTIQKETSSLSNNGAVSKAVAALFDTDNPAFLSQGLTQTMIDNAQLLLDKADKSVEDILATYSDLSTKDFDTRQKTLQLLLETAQQKFDAQSALNDLFDGDLLGIYGSEVHTDLTITEKTTSELLSTTKEKVDGLSEDDWLTAFTDVFDNAKTQVDQVTKATASVTALFDGETVKEDVSEDSYNAAKADVDAILNETLKQAQQTRLDQVKAKLDEKKAAEQEAQKAEAEAQAQANGGTVVQNDDGSYTVQAPSTSNGSAASGGNTSSAGSNSSGSTSGGSSWSGSSTSGGSSSGGGSYGGSSSGSSGGSSSNSGSTGGGSSSGNGNTTSGNTTGGGTIGGYNPDDPNSGGNTWTGGTFNPGDIMP